ncbi:MAG: PQQ-dependent sugar dehydrogenase [Planctomycetota bacterium]
MPRLPIALLAASLVALPACGQPVTGAVPLSGDDVPEATGYELETVLIGLERPWGIAWLPGDSPADAGDILITERPGALRIVRDGVLLDEPAYDRFDNLYASGQGGLMEVSLHPRFEDNGQVYLTYSEGDRNDNRTVLARGTLEGDMLTGVEVLFRVNIDKRGGQHFGSRIVWLPGDTMLLAIGDGGNPPVRYEGEFIRNQAQNPGAHTGKVLHLTQDGTPVNATAAFQGGLPEVFTIGHRNIQGMARDPDTGTIWATEHGARGGDELNIITRGTNYGWPEVTYSREYSGPRISDETAAPGIEDPLVVWTPCKAPSGLAFYTGDKMPAWKGDLFSGALVGRHIRRIDLDGTSVAGEETIPTGARVRDVRQGPDGFLYFITDEQAGELRRIVPAPRPADAAD